MGKEWHRFGNDIAFYEGILLSKKSIFVKFLCFYVFIMNKINYPIFVLLISVFFLGSAFAYSTYNQKTNENELLKQRISDTISGLEDSDLLNLAKNILEQDGYKFALNNNPSLESQDLNTVEEDGDQQEIEEVRTDLNTPNSSNQTQERVLTPSDFRTFTGEEFKNFGDNFNFVGATPITVRPHIRGDQEADRRIQEIAERRGYKLRPQADCRCLVPQAMTAYNQMNMAINREIGNNLVFVSGFRSVEDQRNIFLNAISQWSNQSIAEGRVDEAINQILITRSIPGYSKHHTGYVIDFGCNNSNLLNFKNTLCYKWLSDNNYFNAKRFGFIPSYPAGAGNQGPDPEEWEYIYVGVNNLLL